MLYLTHIHHPGAPWLMKPPRPRGGTNSHEKPQNHIRPGSDDMPRQRPGSGGTAEREVTMEYCERKRILFFGLPFTFTKYVVNENLITIHSGFFKKTENDCYMYKVQDVELTSSLLERLFKIGTVICYTGDTTHPKLILVHIKNARAVKNYILEASEQARLKRRTLNTLNIGAMPDDIDDDPSTLS